MPPDWDAIALQQQAEDRALPLQDRDNIGGVLVSCHLVADPGRDRAVVRIDGFRLPHFDADADMIRAERPETQPPTLARWERCEPWLGAALAYDPAGRTMADVCADYQVGRYVLIDGSRSAALVGPMTAGGNLHLHAYLAGGALAEISAVLRPRWEAFARRLGAALVVITGRKGWARAFARFGYHFVAQTSPTNWITAKDVRAK